jgi:hypothetical protein
LWVIFALLDPDSESGSGSTDQIESGSNPDPDTNPDPQPCKKQTYEGPKAFMIDRKQGLFVNLGKFSCSWIGIQIWDSQMDADPDLKLQSTVNFTAILRSISVGPIIVFIGSSRSHIQIFSSQILKRIKVF